MSDQLYNEISKDGENIIKNLIDDVATLKAREIPFSVTDVSAKVKRTTSQSINNNTNTPLTFQSVVWENGDLWDVGSPTRLTAPIPGIYLVTCNVAFDSSAVGVRRVYVQKNGSINVASDYRNANSASRTEIVISSQIGLDAGDYIELYVFQNSGGALNVFSINDYSPQFTLSYLGLIA